MPTRLFDAINKIVATVEAADGNVIDGPLKPVGDSLDFVYIGYDGDPEGEWLAAQMDQDWASIGSKRREDTFDIWCAVVSRYSADPPETARARVQGQFTLVENSILADPSLGALGSPEYCVAAVHPSQLFAEEGQYRLTFVVRVKTRV